MMLECRRGGLTALIGESKSFLSGSQRCASQVRENEEYGSRIARGILVEYRVQATLDAGPACEYAWRRLSLRPQWLLA
jgi:hypothetical protein